MESFVLNGRQTIILAILVLFLGKFLIGKIAILVVKAIGWAGRDHGETVSLVFHKNKHGSFR